MKCVHCVDNNTHLVIALPLHEDKVTVWCGVTIPSLSAVTFWRGYCHKSANVYGNECLLSRNVEHNSQLAKGKCSKWRRVDINVPSTRVVFSVNRFLTHQFDTELFPAISRFCGRQGHPISLSLIHGCGDSWNPKCTHLIRKLHLIWKMRFDATFNRFLLSRYVVLSTIWNMLSVIVCEGGSMETCET